MSTTNRRHDELVASVLQRQDKQLFFLLATGLCGLLSCTLFLDQKIERKIEMVNKEVNDKFKEVKDTIKEENDKFKEEIKQFIVESNKKKWI